MKEEIVFQISSSPYSLDPMEYDAAVHHQAFRSVYSSLVNLYKKGEILPAIAESWSTDKEQLSWVFKIRPGMTFLNGEIISPKIVKESLTRVAFLIKQKKSKIDFISNLKGYDNLNAPYDSIEGITYSNEAGTVTFQFSKRQEKFLESLSFGIYAIVSSRDWDFRTGKWLNPKLINSSGAYSVLSWDEEQITLSKRNNFPAQLVHAKAFKKIKIIWSQKHKYKPDIVLGTSNKPFEGYSFSGPATSGIAYVHCFSWNNKNSLLNIIDNRIKLRDSLYAKMRKDGITPVLSFFPLSIKGVMESDEVSTFKIDNQKVMLGDNINKLNVRVSDYPELFFEYFKNNIETVLENFSIASSVNIYPIDLLKKQLDPNLVKYDVDLAVINTGILLEDPIGDIKFMFLSKEGIRLPDVNGEITRLVEQKSIDIGKINRLLFEQAIIWPLGHFAKGVWYSSYVDMSQHNNILPPIDFSWVGSNK